MATQSKGRRVSAETLARIVEKSPDLIAVGALDDSGGEALFVNDAGLRMTGYDSSEGLSIATVQPDLPPEALAEVMEKGVWRGESVFVHRDGHKIPVSQSLALEMDEDGKPSCLYTIVRDISEQKKLEHDMGERLKELDCLYGVSDLMTDASLTPDQLYQGIADILPPSWQYPEVTCGRVTADGTEYVSANFRETEWRQHADVVIDGEVIGGIDVFYLEEMPDMGDGEGPFVKEERHLINVLAERVGEYVRRLIVQEQSEMIREQSEAMMQMSTPVIKLWDKVQLLPLIGSIDTTRAAQLTERLLESIVENEIEISIMDVTGVPVIDTSVARSLLKAVDASRMLGADTIITGFSPDAAQSLAQLGVDFSTLRTRGSLRAGVEEAFRLIGGKIVMEK